MKFNFILGVLLLSSICSIAGEYVTNLWDIPTANLQLTNNQKPYKIQLNPFLVSGVYFVCTDYNTNTYIVPGNNTNVPFYIKIYYPDPIPEGIQISTVYQTNLFMIKGKKFRLDHGKAFELDNWDHVYVTNVVEFKYITAVIDGFKYQIMNPVKTNVFFGQ